MPSLNNETNEKEAEPGCHMYFLKEGKGTRCCFLGMAYLHHKPSEKRYS